MSTAVNESLRAHLRCARTHRRHAVEKRRKARVLFAVARTFPPEYEAMYSGAFALQRLARQDLHIAHEAMLRVPAAIDWHAAKLAMSATEVEPGRTGDDPSVTGPTHGDHRFAGAVPVTGPRSAP